MGIMSAVPKTALIQLDYDQLVMLRNGLDLFRAEDSEAVQRKRKLLTWMDSSIRELQERLDKERMKEERQ